MILNVFVIVISFFCTVIVLFELKSDADDCRFLLFAEGFLESFDGCIEGNKISIAQLKGFPDASDFPDLQRNNAAVKIEMREVELPLRLSLFKVSSLLKPFRKNTTKLLKPEQTSSRQMSIFFWDDSIKVWSELHSEEERGAVSANVTMHSAVFILDSRYHIKQFI